MTQPEQVIQELYDCYTKTAANIISYYEDDERTNILNRLRDIAKNNCILDKKMKSAESTKNRLLDMYNDIDDDTNTDIEAIIQEYKRDISEITVDTTNEQNLLEFDKQVEALLDKVENAKEDGNDTELQVTGCHVNIIDPITKKRMEDPVKNMKCGHTYERATITQILKINKKTKCPVAGCKSQEFVTLEQLRADIATKTYLEKHPA
ncbi:E3 SUMO-protein ligase NSE2-like [Colletes gigas]|uniref:E3 SUMO-protein ligase NSE2-like n=1 Tax=Colletes gigas TaxID=935657 RepID=UPI001C9A713B|nr:E3 SUMO-protein ligase NSE2-like [Colletes gigas]